MKIKFLLLFLSSLLLYTACDDSPEVLPELKTTKQLLSFTFEKSKNAAYLEKDIVGTIVNDAIKFTISENIDATKLIATFTHNGKAVMIGSTAQVSGVTANDFTKDLVYTVEAEDGSKKSYSLEVLPQLSTTNQLLSFTLEKSKNPDYLDEDIVGTIENDEIKMTISENIDATKLIATFSHNGKAVLIGSTAQVSGVTANDFTKELFYTVEAEDGSLKSYSLYITWLEVVDASRIPHIYIDTNGKVGITSKDDYVKADVRIDGGDKYEDYEGTTSIKGRGNSTWGMPKKPYRLKLDKKASLLGLSAEKDWILLANYIDKSLMCNAVAFKIGQLLEMPFTHHIIPVDVTLNGVYIGNYMFTEHKEVEDNRINVGDDGWLLEFDTYFDEIWRFRSDNFKLPVMIQYPELEDMEEPEASSIFNIMKDDFNAFEALVKDASFPNNDYLEYFDANAFVNFLIVYTLTDNEEINHPKSTYIYKKKDGKYNMGPIWDFDWAFGFEGTNQHYVNPTRPLFWNNNAEGTRFFSKFVQDPIIKSLYREEWAKFKGQKYPVLVDYIKEYALLIKKSHSEDQKIWKGGSSSSEVYLAKLLSWLDQRVVYMDGLYK